MDYAPKYVRYQPLHFIMKCGIQLSSAERSEPIPQVMIRRVRIMNVVGMPSRQTCITANFQLSDKLLGCGMICGLKTNTSECHFHCSLSDKL